MGKKKKLEIVFHVGPHKTATTSFQTFLSVNTATLLDEGNLVPKWGTYGHHQLPWALMGFNSNLLGALNVPADYLIKLMLIQARAFSSHRIILSSEDFSLLSIANWIKIKNSIRVNGNKHFKVKTKCVYTVRSTNELQKSMYWELLKHGYSKSVVDSNSEIWWHIQKVKWRLRFLPFASKVEIAYNAQNHENLLASVIFNDVTIEELIPPPARENESIITPQILEETRKTNQLLGLDYPKTIFHWPLCFSVDSYTELQEKHRQIISNNQTER
jgi:hypothetical protein